jgi:integrase
MAKKSNFESGTSQYFRVSLFLGYDSRGKKKYKYFYGDGKQDAERKKDEYIHARRNGIDIDRSNQPLETAMKFWLLEKVRTSGIKDNTFDRYMNTFTMHIKGSAISFIKVSEFKPHIIQSYYNKSTDKTYSQLTMTNKLLKRFFDYAILNDMIMKNPTLGVVIPNDVKEKYFIEKKENEYEVFEYNEIERLLEAAYKKHTLYGAILQLAFNYGMRIGEVLGLEIMNVNLDKGYMLVDKSLEYVRVYDGDGNPTHYEFQLLNTKTRSSERKLDFSDKTRQVFIIAEEYRNLSMRKAGSSYKNRMNLVFTTDSGEPIDNRNLIRFWKRLLNSLDIPYRKLHFSRHTFVTSLHEKGVDEITAQNIIGHKKGSSITRAVYTHARQTKIKDVLIDVLGN